MSATGCTWPYGGTVHACAQDADFTVIRAAQETVPYLAAPMCTYHARLSREMLTAAYGAEHVRFAAVLEVEAAT